MTDDKYLVDLRHLADLNKTTVYIGLSECLELQYPTETMDDLVNLLNYMKRHFENMVGKIELKVDLDVFYSLLEKIKANRDYIHELDNYIIDANKKLKEDKGWSKDDMTTVGVPSNSLRVTLDELIVLYKVMEELESLYKFIEKERIVFWKISRYFSNIKSIKDMLEKRLAFAIISKR